MRTLTLQTMAGRTLGGIAVAILLAQQIIGMDPTRWGVPIPDDAHSYGIRFKAGVDLFFTPAVGWFVEHALWMVLAFGIVAVAADLFGQWLNRPGEGGAEATD